MKQAQRHISLATESQKEIAARIADRNHNPAHGVHLKVEDSKLRIAINCENGDDADQVAAYAQMVYRNEIINGAH